MLQLESYGHLVPAKSGLLCAHLALPVLLALKCAHGSNALLKGLLGQCLKSLIFSNFPPLGDRPASYRKSRFRAG